MRQVIMKQRKWGQVEPIITPAASVESALSGFERAVNNGNVTFVEIGETRPNEINGHNTYYSLITFTRYGDQEFVDGHKPWWDSAR